MTGRESVVANLRLLTVFSLYEDKRSELHFTATLIVEAVYRLFISVCLEHGAGM